MPYVCYRRPLCQFFALNSQLDDEDKYQHCAKLELKCAHCLQTKPFSGVLRIDPKATDQVSKQASKRAGEQACLCVRSVAADSFVSTKQILKFRSGAECPNCERALNRVRVGNQLCSFMQKCIDTYYDTWLVCDEDTCRARTQSVIQHHSGRLQCIMRNCKGTMHPVYPAEQLAQQLQYLKYLFDVPAFESKLARLEHAPQELVAHQRAEATRHRAFFEHQRALVEQFVALNARNFVDMSALFAFLEPMRATDH